MGNKKSSLSGTKAILLYLHETITEETEGILFLTRKVSKAAGIDLMNFTDEELNSLKNEIIMRGGKAR